MDNSDLSTLDDDELMRRTELLAEMTRSVTCDLVLHVAELDRRTALARRGFTSTFDYCTARLRFSEGAAYRLIRAARSYKKMPGLEPFLRQGRLSIESVALLHPFLRDDDAGTLVMRCLDQTTRAVEALLARRQNAPPLRDSIRPVGMAAITPSPRPPAGPPLILDADTPSSSTPDAERERLISWIRFAADEGFLAKLRRAQQVMRHKYPDGRLEDLLGDALDALLDKKDMDRIIARREKQRARPASPTGARR